MSDADKIKELSKQIGGLALENDMLRARHRGEEVAWLVEILGAVPTYYSFAVDDPDSLWGGFDPDVNKATRFARREDAEALIKVAGWSGPRVSATEHIWSDNLVASRA